jgi:hypothetical protein
MALFIDVIQRKHYRNQKRYDHKKLHLQLYRPEYHLQTPNQKSQPLLAPYADLEHDP